MKRLNVGVIGLGEVAQIIHLPVLRSLPELYDIRAVCDISEQLVETIGALYGVTQRYTDASKLCEQNDLDIVFVLNSDEYHAECAIQAMNNGKHVFIEKPMCLTNREADEIIHARDANNVQVMVGYMRRYAPAFTEAKKVISELGDIKYIRVRDIIGQNGLMIEQSSHVYRFDDIPQAAKDDRWHRAGKLVQEAIGDVPQKVANSYRLMCGLSSHDLSAMRELIAFPERVASAVHWNDGYYISAIFEFDGYFGTFETGVDHQRRFDAHLEVFSDTKQMKVQYNTPYIRHLPTTLELKETNGDAYEENVLRPTFSDPYTTELRILHQHIMEGSTPKTTPEDFKEDLRLFGQMVDALLVHY